MNGESAYAPATPESQEPIRAEVFGIERLERHAESLAAAEKLTDSSARGRSLLPRARENGRALLRAYREVADSVRDKREISLAEEWLLDNYHVVDEQLREIGDHLPKGYYRKLPKLTTGHRLRQDSGRSAVADVLGSGDPTELEIPYATAISATNDRHRSAKSRRWSASGT